MAIDDPAGEAIEAVQRRRNPYERRKPPIRRHWLDAFTGSDGQFRTTYFFATCGQIMCLVLLGWHFAELRDHWEMVLLLLGGATGGDAVKKLAALKYGSTR